MKSFDAKRPSMSADLRFEAADAAELAAVDGGWVLIAAGVIAAGVAIMSGFITGAATNNCTCQK